MTPVSFIVIGKNEGFKLQKCLAGLMDYIRHHQLAGYEIIYVDSRSSDGSVQLVREQFKEVQVAVLTGDCSAGIARNAGAMIAGNPLFIFLDGDMVLRRDFSISDKINPDTCTLFSGQIQNYIYDSSYSAVLETSFYYPGLTADRKERFFGGLFAIDAALWKKYHGMRTEFVLGEDLDLSLRLSSDGYFLTRYAAVMADHHTTEKKMSLKMLWRMSSYSRGFLYRKNLFRKTTLHRILRSDPTVPVLLSALVLTGIFQTWLAVPVYALLVLCAVAYAERKTPERIPVRFFTQLPRDIFVFIHFFTFFPKKGSVSYQVIHD